MTNRELIKLLLDLPLDAQVYRTAGADPKANVLVDSARMEQSYGNPDEGWSAVGIVLR